LPRSINGTRTTSRDPRGIPLEPVACGDETPPHTTLLGKYSGRYDELFRSEGIRIVKTPVRAPKANAIAERFVRTLRSECLDWLLILNRRHLEHVLRIYVDHYNRERPHRSLNLNTKRAPVIDSIAARIGAP